MEEKKVEFVEDKESDFICPYCGVVLDKILWKTCVAFALFGRHVKTGMLYACPACRKVLNATHIF